MIERELFETRYDWRVTLDLPDLSLTSKPWRGVFEDASGVALGLVDTMANSPDIVPKKEDAALVLSAKDQLLPTAMKALDVLYEASDGNCVIMLQKRVFDAWINWDEGDPS